MPEPDKLAELAAQYVNATDNHIFLTGKAGTGKTTFLKNIVNHTYKNTVIAAPTGIAAINAGGVTLHSLLQLPFGIFIPENIPPTFGNERINTPQTLFQNFRFNKSKRQLIQQLELLIIDEVSMLRADLLDCIDVMLRHLRKIRNKPFGGLQILFIGDLLQLPPVVKNEDLSLLDKYYKSPYFFNARALQGTPPILVELQKVYRQTDDQFISILNRLRNNEQTTDDIALLNKYHKSDIDDAQYDGYIHLTTHNYKADSINETKLNALEGKEHAYEADISGDFNEHLFPTHNKLVLKKDAQVMFIKNDPTGEGRFFNGKIGKVNFLDSSSIWVEFDNGEKVNVEPYEWENKRYTLNKNTNEVEEKYLGKFKQYPLKPAWAVTIHKSQGLTFERAILDLSDTFAPGQLYVALSRLTSLDGLVLSSPLPLHPPGIEKDLHQFMATHTSRDDLSNRLEHDKKEFLYRFAAKAFQFDELLRFLHYHVKSFNKAENRSIKQQYLSWTNDLVNDIRKLHDVGAKFVKQVQSITQKDDFIGELNARMEKAWEYFHKEIITLLDRSTAHRKSMQKENRASTYVKELKEIESIFFSQLKQIEKLILLVNATSENKELSKQTLLESSLLQPLPKEKKVKKEKTPTAEISFNMFKEGKSIAEIAMEREFVQSTIEGHLCAYVKSGDIEIAAILDKGKCDKILERVKKGVDGLGHLKHELGEDISYGEIKLALAHQEWINSSIKQTENG